MQESLPAGRCFSAFTIGETRCQLHLTLKQNPYRCLSQLRPGEKVVSFPPDPSQEDDRLENLIVATMLTFKSAGPDRKSINFGLYCLPSDGSSNVPLMTPLRLTLEDNHLLVTALHTS